MRKVLRYLAELLWHWSVPFMFGMGVSGLLFTWQLNDLAPIINQGLAAAVAPCIGG